MRREEKAPSICDVQTHRGLAAIARGIFFAAQGPRFHTANNIISETHKFSCAYIFRSFDL
jgi:hypothetical protein